MFNWCFCQSISPGLVKTEFLGRLQKRSDVCAAYENVDGVSGGRTFIPLYCVILKPLIYNIHDSNYISL